MDHTDLVDRLGRLEKEIRDLREGTDSPAIENCMREIGVFLFLAKQYAGVWDAICPEELA